MLAFGELLVELVAVFELAVFPDLAVSILVPPGQLVAPLSISTVLPDQEVVDLVLEDLAGV